MAIFTSPFWHFTAHRVGHNEVIGVCRAGPDAEGLGRDHWNEMLAYPRKPITHWHALGEVHISLTNQRRAVFKIKHTLRTACKCDKLIDAAFRQ